MASSPAHLQWLRRVEATASVQQQTSARLSARVHRAVGVLLDALDREDRASAGALLRDVAASEAYDAAVFVVMRLVVLLCADGRGLPVLRRGAAWPRLLLLFQEAHAAQGTALFDPARFPFLDRAALDEGTCAKLIDALLEGDAPGYAALEVEHLGHLYESLLDQTAGRDADGRLVLESTGHRRDTGTHYTPPALSEEVVRAALEPLVYDGPARGAPREAWTLRPVPLLLSLRLCDLAMGSGAFLVQACRYLADRLLESWEAGEREAGAQLAPGPDGALRASPDAIRDRRALALRLVAERCLFGVDTNATAVEMARQSLGLLTGGLGSLAYALRVGDSLLGVRSLAQLERFSLAESAPSDPVVGPVVGAWIARALGARLADPSGPEAQAAFARLRLVADLLVGLELRGEPRDRERARHGLSDEGRLGELAELARLLLGEARPLHWPLEFPEVFLRAEPGFDACLGNPPFLGGTRISTVLGAGYSECLKRLFPGAGNRADLVVYFLRRAYGLVREPGTLGYVTTNAISKGDSRAGGLEWLLAHGATAYAARRTVPWPGVASVWVHLVHLAKGGGPWRCELDGASVPAISALLDDADRSVRPQRLAANRGLSHEGFKIYGQGFLFDDADPKATPLARRDELLAADPRHAERIRPYLGGEEVNDSPTHEGRRYVIDFGEESLEEAARWPELLAIVEAKVRPERATKEGQVGRAPWWRFFCTRPELRRALPRLRRVLVCSKVTTHLVFAWLPTHVACSHKLAVFARDDDAFFGVLQSQVHEAFVRVWSSTLGRSLNYSPSDAFETFPLPREQGGGSPLARAARELYEARAATMVREQVGLTRLYNRLHDSKEQGEELQRLRELHRALDVAVLAAYGWEDVRPGHGFHATDAGQRFGLSDAARAEVVSRLGTLNHERAEAEAQGATRAAAAPAPMPASVPAAPRGTTGDLFGRTRPAPVEPSAALLACLQAAPHALTKAEALGRAGLPESAWKAALAPLLERGEVEVVGRTRGARYRVAVR